VTVKGARKGRSKATSRKVKSKEIVDDVASDESSKEKEDAGVCATENSVDGKRKRQSQKSKPGTVDKDGKPSRKRQIKNKVCKDIILYVTTAGALLMSLQFSYCWVRQKKSSVLHMSTR